jgi:hypothetical protein
VAKRSLQRAPFKVGDIVRYRDPLLPEEKRVLREVIAVRQNRYAESGWVIETAERRCGHCGCNRSQVFGFVDSRYFRLIRHS